MQSGDNSLDGSDRRQVWRQVCRNIGWTVKYSGINARRDAVRRYYFRWPERRDAAFVAERVGLSAGAVIDIRDQLFADMNREAEAVKRLLNCAAEQRAVVTGDPPHWHKDLMQ